MGGRHGDGHVLWPVLHQVVDHLARLGAQDGLADGAVRFVRRADQLDVGTVTVEGIGIADPPVEPRK